MKRPKKLVKYFNIESKPSEWVDWNGKPTRDYFIRIPYWIVRAYRLHKKSPAFGLKLIISDQFKSMNIRKQEENRSVLRKYFTSNWTKKMTKMRKLNGNFLQIEEVIATLPTKKKNHIQKN